MTDDEFLSYRDDRYSKALEYYDNGAKHNKFWYRVCSIYVLLVSVAISPILTIDLPFDFNGKIIAAILAPTVAFVAGLASHFRFHENWISFRATWDALKHEVPWRDAKVGQYSESVDRNALFVSRIEALISHEGTQWYERHASKESKK